MTLEPYLNFPGTCEEALNFYQQCFQGEIVSLSYFDSAQMPVPDAYKKKVLHAVFKFGNATLMASDSLPDYPFTSGTNVSLSVNFDELAGMDAIFQHLAAGGRITMPLQDTFWGARFGMLTDQYGINWMFNCEQNK